jgi:hypothetical protein
MAKTPSKQTAAASKAPVKKAGKAAGGKKKKRTESYSSYIYKVLKQVSQSEDPDVDACLTSRVLAHCLLYFLLSFQQGPP